MTVIGDMVLFPVAHSSYWRYRNTQTAAHMTCYSLLPYALRLILSVLTTFIERRVCSVRVIREVIAEITLHVTTVQLQCSNPTPTARDLRSTRH